MISYYVPIAAQSKLYSQIFARHFRTLAFIWYSIGQELVSLVFLQMQSGVSLSFCHWITDKIVPIPQTTY